MDECKGFGGAKTHKIDINRSELAQAEHAFTEDMQAIKALISWGDNDDWDMDWPSAGNDEYRNLHKFLQRIVDLANHAGAHAATIEGLRLKAQ